MVGHETWTDQHVLTSLKKCHADPKSAEAAPGLFLLLRHRICSQKLLPEPLVQRTPWREHRLCLTTSPESRMRLKSSRQSEISAELILGKLIQLGPSFLQAKAHASAGRKKVFRMWAEIKRRRTARHLLHVKRLQYDTPKPNSRPRRRTTSNPEC